MSELPPGWTRASLGEVTSEPTQHVPAHAETFQYIDIASVDRDTKRITAPQELRGDNAPSRARKVLRAGDVLVSMTRPNLNAVAIVPPELDGQIASTGFDVLRPSEVEPRYLFGIVRSQEFVQTMSDLVQGALYPAVRSRDVRAYVAPVAPLPEQRRISDKLDTVLSIVDTCRVRLDRVPQILQRFREAVLEAAVSGKLTEEWRESRTIRLSSEDQVRNREESRAGRLRVRTQGAAISKLDLPVMPDSWAWIQNHRLAMDSETAICAGPFGTTFKAKDFRPNGVPIIFLRHISAGQYLTRKPGFMDEATWRELHQPYSAFGGELLVAKLGDPPGTACIYPDNQGVAMVTPDVMKMSVDAKVALTKYLMYFFNSPLSRRLTQQLAFGVTRLRIDLGMFKTFPIPLPTLGEQKEIVHRVDDLFALAEALERRWADAVSRVEKLTPSVLAKAFRGGLVPQDPNDEPAGDLLERIRKVRESKVAEGSRGKLTRAATEKRGKVKGGRR